ncbi:MAG: hypothetical protein ABJZ55_12845 [Fuerstiella sp.]
MPDRTDQPNPDDRYSLVKAAIRWLPKGTVCPSASVATFLSRCETFTIVLGGGLV